MFSCLHTVGLECHVEDLVLLGHLFLFQEPKHIENYIRMQCVIDVDHKPIQRVHTSQ